MNVDDMILGVDAVPTLVKYHFARFTVHQLLLFDVPIKKVKKGALYRAEWEKQMVCGWRTPGKKHRWKNLNIKWFRYPVPFSAYGHLFGGYEEKKQGQGPLLLGHCKKNKCGDRHQANKGNAKGMWKIKGEKWLWDWVEGFPNSKKNLQCAAQTNRKKGQNGKKMADDEIRKCREKTIFPLLLFRQKKLCVLLQLNH